MAQTGFTPILIYSSSTAAAAPLASNLTNSTLGSELAINITDGKLFYKDNANAVQVIGWKTVPVSAGGTGLTSLTANGVLYASSTSTMATNANLTWNGTTLEIGGSVSAGGQFSAYSATNGAIGVFSDAVTTFTAGIAVSSAVGPDISFSKNRGTFASPTGVNNGDTVGRLRWIARDVTGGTAREVARIDSLVDSVPAADDISGSLIFRTRQSGSGGALTIAGRINRLQNWAIGDSSPANISLRILKAITGSTNSFGVYSDGTIQPTVTNLGNYYASVHATAANSGTPYTIGTIYGYQATQGTFNADSTVTDQMGFFAGSALISATNNYGFYSNIASGTGRWNFYANNTANNAFRGNSRFGGLTAPTVAVDVTGAILATGNVTGGYNNPAAGTTAMAFGSYNVVQVTPNATATYTTTVPAAGTRLSLIILTSGTTSYTITFGTGFKTTGTLTTGATSARYFVISFVSDGTSVIETSRTVAIA
jgi:hypothetical protein